MPHTLLPNAMIRAITSAMFVKCSISNPLFLFVYVTDYYQTLLPHTLFP